MSAYKGLLSDQDSQDLVTYYTAVAWFPVPDQEGAPARVEVALTSGCFACHGPAGKGGISNPGSFKGCVPGWDSSGYAELVCTDDELREWILDGVSKRFAMNPAAQVFLRRAPLKIPKYDDVLAEADRRKPEAYICHVRQQPASSAKAAGSE